nr:MAG TPA: hypothetical protein [Caudoviricetes sp.]
MLRSGAGFYVNCSTGLPLLSARIHPTPLPGIHLVRARPIAAHLFRISPSFSASFSP